MFCGSLTSDFSKKANVAAIWKHKVMWLNVDWKTKDRECCTGKVGGLNDRQYLLAVQIKSIIGNKDQGKRAAHIIQGTHHVTT